MYLKDESEAKQTVETHYLKHVHIQLSYIESVTCGSMEGTLDRMKYNNTIIYCLSNKVLLYCAKEGKSA